MAKKKIPSIVKQVLAKNIPDMDYSYEKAISHSQITIYDTCPYRWKLQYKDKLKPFSDSINTVFGKAIHYAIQTYLDVMYKTSKAKADNLNIVELFKDSFKKEYLKSYKSNNNTHFSSPDEMREFYEDGEQILDFFQKKVSLYFGKRGWHFIGFELPINVVPLKSHKNVKYIGFLDLVFYDESIEKFLIVDIKTSKKSWGDYQKKNFQKMSQLVLYKKYFSEQYGVPAEDVEIQFFIVKRKLYENSDFHQKRIQTFSPAAGKNNMNKAHRNIEEFIKENFNEDGTIKDKEYEKKPGEWSCKWCPFNDRNDICNKKMT